MSSTHHTRLKIGTKTVKIRQGVKTRQLHQSFQNIGSSLRQTDEGQFRWSIFYIFSRIIVLFSPLYTIFLSYFAPIDGVFLNACCVLHLK